MHHDWRVHQPRGEIKEEWFALILPHKRHGIFGRLIERKTVFIQTIWIIRVTGGKSSQTILHAALYATAMTCVVEALILRLRIAVVTHGNVPLATVPSGIAIGFECLCNRHGFRWQTSTIPRRQDRPPVTMRMGWFAARNMRHLRTSWMIPTKDRST